CAARTDEVRHERDAINVARPETATVTMNDQPTATMTAVEPKQRRPRARDRNRARGGGSSATMRMLAWGVTAILALGLAGVLSGVVQLGEPTGALGGDSAGARDIDGSWSYYHDREFDTGGSG